MDNQSLTKKIIIVDDEISFINMFSAVLKPLAIIKGYTVPKEALLEIPGEKPDLVLLDIKMPGLNGFEVFEHLKNDLKEKAPKIIFLTNLGETVSGAQIDEHFAKSIGASGYIRKTDDLDIVVKKVKEALGV